MGINGACAGQTCCIDAASLLANSQMKVKLVLTMLLGVASWPGGGASKDACVLSPGPVLPGHKLMTLSATMLQWLPSHTNFIHIYLCHSKYSNQYNCYFWPGATLLLGKRMAGRTIGTCKSCKGLVAI